MFSKLALRNVRRSFRDYGVYLLTLTFGVCLFYTFNSLDGQGAMILLSKSVRQHQGGPGDHGPGGGAPLLLASGHLVGVLVQAVPSTGPPPAPSSSTGRSLPASRARSWPNSAGSGWALCFKTSICWIP